MEIAKKRGKYRAVTRPTLGLFLNEECRMKNVECRMKNEECRMKNEEWELLFLFVKREEGKIALTQLLNEECRMKNEEWELHFIILVKSEKSR